MKRSSTLILQLLFCLIISACSADNSTPVKQIATASATNTASPPSRFGVIQLEPYQNSGISGTFTARANNDGTTTLIIQLDQAADFNPWGIFSTGDCQGGVPENTRPIFTLPDIEGGTKEETVETAAYAAAPGNLIVVVYGIAPDGSQKMVTCNSLGLPSSVDETQATLASLTNCKNPAVTSLTGNWLAFTASKNKSGLQRAICHHS